MFGDIGTSPLCTLQTVLDVTGDVHLNPEAILGALSLILWTLIIVTSLKYVTLALRLDNNGEGGILALMALLRRMHERRQSLILFLSLCGAALVYGDAAITPAISVPVGSGGAEHGGPSSGALRAARGRRDPDRAVRGAEAGHRAHRRLLEPVMLIWYVALSLLGLWEIAQHPAVLWALNPAVGLRYLLAGGGITTLLVVGGVFLLRHRGRSAVC